jgi:hypothetical protein
MITTLEYPTESLSKRRKINQKTPEELESMDHDARRVGGDSE